jgi:hypothetical protein
VVQARLGDRRPMKGVTVKRRSSSHQTIERQDHGA